MPTADSIDQILDNLIGISEALFTNTVRKGIGEVRNLAAERGRVLQALESCARDGRVTPEQTAKARRALEAGRQTQQSIAIARESLLERIQELRSARRIQESLKPYRPERHRLNIRL